MKTTIFTLLFTFISFSVISAVYTVDNKPNSSANYSDLQTAVDNASAGDTLYIMGSTTSYGTVTIKKKLALIGAGYKVDNQWGLTTTLGSITYDEGVLTDPTESYLSGVSCNTISIKTGTSYFIERCYTDNIWFYNNTSCVIRNSIIDAVYIGNYISNVTVQNTIIRYGLYSYNQSTSLLVDHCLFVDGNLEYSQLKYAIITNSIVFAVSTAGAEFTTFNNNISIAGAETTFLYGTNTGGNNLPDTDPKFVVVTNNKFSYENDYRLQAGSPAVGTATDGTDIGIYGGSFPFPIGGEGEYLMAAPPSIPQILELNILNASLPEGGTLQVNVKARSQD